MGTPWTEIICNFAMPVMDDVRLIDQMGENPALFFRRMALYMDLAIPMVSRPPELDSYLNYELVKPVYDDMIWRSTSESLEGETTVEAQLKQMIFTIGENMSIRRFDVIEGDLVSYIHGMGSIGVIVKFEADEAAAANEGYAEVKKNVALHVAAQAAVPYIAREDVPASVIAEEKSVLLAQLANDPANAKKPQQVLEKIVEGRLGKFFEANCLLEQEYVKAENKESVAKYLADSGMAFGGSIKVANFFRYE